MISCTERNNGISNRLFLCVQKFRRVDKRQYYFGKLVCAVDRLVSEKKKKERGRKLKEEEIVET